MFKSFGRALMQAAEVFGKVYQQQAAQNQQAGAQPGADAGNAGASNDGTVETDYQVHDDK